jgi:uncharacterized surface anchored protein
MNKSIKNRCWHAAAILLILLAALAAPNYAAAQTGQISGTVKDSSGNLLQDVEVYVYDVNDTSGIDPFPVTTNEDGTFTAPDLLPGEYRYKVRFKKENYIEQWHEGVPMIDCAEPVTVTDGGDTKIDAVLKEGTSSAARRSFAQAAPTAAGTGVISGSVSLNGEPLKCAKVEAYNAADDSYVDTDLILTDYQGNYTISGLAVGSYKILFYDQNDQAGQWHNRKADVACADAVPETASDINAAFPVSLQQCGDRPTLLPAIKLLLN